jgi:hypothetical protein
MTITVEEPSLDLADPTELAPEADVEATIEAFTDLLKAAVPTPAPVAPAPTMTVPAAAVTFTRLNPGGPVPGPSATWIVDPSAKVELSASMLAAMGWVIPPIEHFKRSMSEMTDAPEVTDLHIADLCDKAAAYIEANGWTQWSMYQGRAACLVGALERESLRYSRERGLIFQRCREEVSLFLGRTYGHHVHPETWNDRPGRTKEEVIGALRGTAQGLRAQAAASA